jgi:hypothetical protein
VWKIIPPPGSDPRIVQPAATLYTDCAIPAVLGEVRTESVIQLDVFSLKPRKLAVDIWKPKKIML